MLVFESGFYGLVKSGVRLRKRETDKEEIERERERRTNKQTGKGDFQDKRTHTRRANMNVPKHVRFPENKKKQKKLYFILRSKQNTAKPRMSRHRLRS